ncbi:MAG: radical SAM protein [Myxococcota bacterium]|nr:radical SAM protein [Myxococcota bacterium]
MARIFLTHPYLLKNDAHQSKLKQPYPPLGTLQVAAVLKSSGHEVIWCDPTFEMGLSKLKQQIRQSGASVLAIVPDDHSVQIKQCTAPVRQVMLDLIGFAKDLQLRTVVSGPDASDNPLVFLNAGSTAVISGEPVNALSEWLDASGDTQVDGIWGQFGAQGRRQPEKELDAWPDALWSICDLEPYKTMWKRNHGYWEINVWTARGCPYRCHWCAKPIWGRSLSMRSPSRVWTEIQYLRRHYSPDRIWFTDDIFAIKPAWLSKFTALVGNNPIPFRCLSRADLLKDPSYAQDLAMAGCHTVWMGAESGSNSVLEAMGKDATVEDATQAVRLLKANQIGSGLFLQLGYPGEHLRDVIKTIEMVRELNPDEIGVSVSYPLPGTVFYEQVEHALKQLQWSNSMSNETLHPAPYQVQFYRYAKSVLRSTHSSKQLKCRTKYFFRSPNLTSARNVLASLGHRVHLPFAMRRMKRAAIPNPDAVELSLDSPDLTG